MTRIVFEDEASWEAHLSETRAATLADVGFLWDWQINRGIPFVPESLVPVLRALVAGEPLEDQAGWEWVASARADERDYESQDLGGYVELLPIEGDKP